MFQKKENSSNSISEIKAVWDKFDLDKNEDLSVAEVEHFLTQLGKRIPNNQKKKILNELDRLDFIVSPFETAL